MRSFVSYFAGVLVLSGLSATAAADDYTVDAMHSSVSFKIEHMGISYVHGRFNSFSGTFKIDSADPAKNSFNFAIKTQSVDTNNQGRDNHLRSPDFFNAKQYASITFKSSAVKPGADGGLEVTGDLTMHGETKPITLTLKGGKTLSDPRMGTKIGYYGEFTINRSDFGVAKGMGPKKLGEDVQVSVGLEATKKK